MTHPFRFGLQISSLPGEGWAEQVREIEALGYSTLFVPDHFGPQWDPSVLMTAAAVATERLKVGTLVYDVDYRHPVIFAKAAATLQIVSQGRHEFGLGAGWMKTDYDEAGMPYDRPSLRIERLDEALSICRSMWTQPKTSFSGKHYQVTEIANAAPLAPDSSPKVLVGGGGPKLLEVAGRHADIVGINPTMVEGRITSRTAADCAPERVREKIRWLHDAAEAAGRDPASIELNCLVFVAEICDDPKPIREALAKGSGMTPEEVADSPIFLTGSAQEIRERIEARREQTGISYLALQARSEEGTRRFAEEVIQPLVKASAV